MQRNTRHRVKRVYRLKNGRRARLVAALLLSAVCLCSLAMAAAPHSQVVAAERPLLQVVVRSGDTLWGLAAQYSQQSRDMRLAVDEILRINELATAELQPGQVILVPGR